MDYFIKETKSCRCGAINVFYDADTLKSGYECLECGQNIENSNLNINIQEFIQKTLPKNIQPKIIDHKILLNTHDCAILLNSNLQNESIPNLQRKVRKYINDGLIDGEKIRARYLVNWPSLFNYIRLSKKEKPKLSTKEVSCLLGISVEKIRKMLYNDTHPQYYGYKLNPKGKWIIEER
ncbi:hypothetical protein [Methanospirillum lacunae]|uniref:Uncharacterized protein n=1 Tax=Methanospirillum lacunae TaxID=668570 RepID=A0A2V2N790_9EURY|nr:hypothetical protein [Methanospirillum lacunae]PWR71411.1 hypothetical protein DK846_11130 [Methanospirillum lacunae]